jgi:hypothetical protein
LARTASQQFETPFEAGSFAREFGAAHNDFGRLRIVGAEVLEIGPRSFQLGLQLSQATENVGGRRLRNRRHLADYTTIADASPKTFVGASVPPSWQVRAELTRLNQRFGHFRTIAA